MSQARALLSDDAQARAMRPRSPGRTALIMHKSVIEEDENVDMFFDKTSPALQSQ